MSACKFFPRRVLFTVFLILDSCFLLLSGPAFANSIYNRSPWPPAYQGLDVEKENTDFQDAAHPCSRSHGRSFQVTHPEGFNLFGLSVYVYVPNSQDGKFNSNLFRLSFLDTNNHQLSTNISPTYSGVLWMDGGGRTTEVYFPLGISINGGVTYTAVLECLTDEPDTFRVPESSRVPDGLITGYYDSTTKTTSPYYMEGRKVLFTTFSPRNSPHFPPVPPPTNNEQSTNNPLPKFHPVILVHGLGGDPANFESDSENRNYVKLLTDLGYPRDYIHLYSYGFKYDPLKRVNYYNYQGDVKETAQGMEVVVNSLSELNKSQGGNGQVDIVAHSLGNLVTRQYLLTHKDNHRVRRYIAVGAPFKGSWIAGIDAGARSVPVLGDVAEKYLAKYIFEGINKIRGNKPLDRTSVVYSQLAPGSDYLNALNSVQISGIELYTVYGDVNATVRQKIFDVTLEKKFDAGDGIILSQSANYTGWTSNHKRSYSVGGNAVLDLKYERKGSALAAEFSVASLTDIRSLHSDLLTKSEPKKEIKCFLVEENTDGC